MSTLSYPQQPVSVRKTPQHYFDALNEADIQFYEFIKSNVTVSNALPFDIPITEFFNVVTKCMKFFWTWDSSSTEEISYYIPHSEIIKNKRGTGYALKLPFSVENVFGWHLTSQAFNPALANFLRWNYIQTYASNVGSPMAGQSFRDNYKVSNASLSNLVIQLYEFESYREMFGRVISASFNNNTSILQLRGPIDGCSGLVIDIFERVLPEDLYDLLDFQEYVQACIEEQLGKIATSFDFPLIGGVKLNYDILRDNGKEKRQAIEESIKEAGGNHDMVFFKK